MMKISYKKIFAVILASLMLCTFNILAETDESLIDCDFKNDSPEDWGMFTTGSAAISVEGDFAVMNCDTTVSGTNAGAYLSAPAASFAKKPYIIYVKSNLSAESSIAAGSTRTAVLTSSDKVLFTIVSDGSTIKLLPYGNSEYASEFSRNTDNDLVIYVDPDSGTSVMWLDNEKVFDGAAPGWISSFDYSNTSLIFINSVSASNLVSVWNIDKVYLGFPGEIQTVSNPVNNSIMVDSTSLDFAQIDFGSIISPSVKESIVLKSGNDAETLLEEAFVVKYFGDKIYIAPESGFLPLKTYKIQINDIKNTDGSSFGEYSIVFSTAPEGYEAPVVTITSPEENITVFEGQSVTVSASTESIADIEYAEFMVDGVLAYTSYSAPYSYTINSIEYGTHNVYVRAYDVYGGSNISETITITAEHNTLPTVSIAGISDGETLSSGALVEFTAVAEDEEGEITKVVLYVNGTEYCEKTEAPFNFSLSDLPTGICEIKVRAYDLAETFGESVVNVSVIKSVTKLIVDENFDDYSGGVPETANISNISNGGYKDTIEIDSQHGTSMTIGANANTSGIGTGIGISHVSNNLITTEFDIYFPSYDAKFTLLARNVDNGSNLTFFTFGTDGKITMNGSGGTVLSGERYETGKWYRIKHVLNGADNTYDCYIGEVSYVNGEKVVDYVQYAQNRLASGADKVTQISSVRLVAITTNNVPGYVVVDDLFSDAIEQMPYITGVSSVVDDEITEGVSFDADKILVKLSRIIAATDVKKITTLKDEISTVPIISAVYSEEMGGILVTPARKLNSNMNHTVTFGSTLPVNNGEQLGYELSAEFNTVSKSFDVSNGTFIRNGNNVKFKVNAENHSGSSKNITVVITAWNGSKLISSGAYETVLANGAESAAETISINTEGATKVEGYAFETLKPLKLIGNMIWVE